MARKGCEKQAIWVKFKIIDNGESENLKILPSEPLLFQYYFTKNISRA